MSDARHLLQVIRDYMHPILKENAENIVLNELKVSLLTPITELIQLSQELFPRSHLHAIVIEWLSSVVLLLDR